MNEQFDETVFWPEFQAAGMLRRARIKPTGRPAVDVYVGWSQPDDRSRADAQTTEYQIEYQHAELPTLAQGDAVVLLDDDGVPIKGSKFYVRQPPATTNDFNPLQNVSGFFRYAVLSKVD